MQDQYVWEWEQLILIIVNSQQLELGITWAHIISQVSYIYLLDCVATESVHSLALADPGLTPFQALEGYNCYY